MPAKKNNTSFSYKKVLAGFVLKPKRKVIKATRKGLKKSKKNLDQTAKLMGIKIALDAVGIKNPATRKKLKNILLNHFGQIALMVKPGKKTLKEKANDANTIFRLKARVTNRLIEELGREQGKKISVLLALTESKRDVIYQELIKKDPLITRAIKKIKK